MKAVAALVLAVALGACSSGGGNKATPATSTSTTAPETTVAAGAPKATTAQATTSTTGPTLSLTAFKSPTGNIGCMLGADGVRCDIREFAYSPPPKPATCELDWGDAIELPGQGKAAFSCHGDTVFDASAPVLPYGSRARQGSLACTSTEGGISCFHEGAANGFIISRQTYSLS